MKTCSKCKQRQAETRFHRDSGRKDGRTPWCKLCVATKSRAWEATHKQKRAAQHKKYYADHRVALVLKSHAFYVRKKTKIKARQRAYYRTHKTQVNARSQKYASSHRELATAKNHYRFAHTKKMWQFKHYHQMKFYRAWDSAQGTPKAAVVFAHHAEKWMRQHCPCPGKGWELHIEKTTKHPNGYFGPSGFRWLRRVDVHQKIELAKAMRIVEAAGYEIRAV